MAPLGRGDCVACGRHQACTKSVRSSRLCADSQQPTLPPFAHQIEKYEYEIEELGATTGKKKSKPPPRIEFLQNVIGVHKKHITKLEAALRCLDNDALEAEDLDPIRDSLEYYLVRRWEGWRAAGGGLEGWRGPGHRRPGGGGGCGPTVPVVVRVWS